MDHGTLDNYLFQVNQLEFGKFHEISVRTTKAIVYLHKEMPTENHYDIEPGNVLLDSNSTPKVADFGLAKRCNRDITHMTLTGGRGTPGDDMDELMVVCGIEENRSKVENMAKVALWCVQYKPKARPSVTVEVKGLEEAIRGSTADIPTTYTTGTTSSFDSGSPQNKSGQTIFWNGKVAASGGCCGVANTIASTGGLLLSHKQIGVHSSNILGLGLRSCAEEPIRKDAHDWDHHINDAYNCMHIVVQ
ncbi:hypothetical protein AAG906_015786 [Vitis piasezkii]